MKFSELWLREWVNPAIDTTKLCDQITMLGLEVDAVEQVAGQFSGVVVGEVIDCVAHPDADKLRVTKVNIGQTQLLNIVCGAPNCRQGLKVACAIDGAVLPNDFKIKKTKLRGEISEGMLCSFSELAIPMESTGIIELPDDAPVGMDLREYLKLDDKSIEISLTPNRADCLSIAGIAREVGVINQIQVVSPKIDIVIPTIDGKVEIELKEPEACPRYLLRVIKNVNIKTNSPLWLQEKLRRCGIRSIDPVVDITNYILLELGQPMHAFDLAKIASPIEVRMAKTGEELLLLDGTTAKLQSNTLVIADKNGPLAMAGIFGGKSSGVSENTQDIILEAAFFAPLAISGKARQYGLHTDASHRFERGVDPEFTRSAMERATALLLEICGGEAGEIVEKCDSKFLPQSHRLILRRSKLDALLGHHIPTETVTDILTRLGLNVQFEQNTWITQSPSWRFDLEIEEDLVEEIARIYGYNQIPNNAPLAHLSMRLQCESQLELMRIKLALVDSGYQEAVTYSFVDPKIQALLHPAEEAMILPNPISSEMSAMRVSLLTGLINAVVYNQNRQQNRIRIFEAGLRFMPNQHAENGVDQEMVLGAIITGSRQGEYWGNKSENVDFFDLKGDLERILSLTHIRDSVRFVEKNYPALHPGQSAAILLEDKEIGFIGTIHPQIAQKIGLIHKAIAFEISLPAIAQKNIPQAVEISKFPANKRDLAIVVEEHIPANDILDACREVLGDKLTNIYLFDIYQGGSIAKGTKSLAISLILQAVHKTLGEEEINESIQSVLMMLSKRFNAYLRE